MLISLPIKSMNTYEYDGGNYTIGVGETIYLEIGSGYEYVLDTPIHNFIWILDSDDNDKIEMISDNQSVGRCAFKGLKTTTTPVKVTCKILYKIVDDTFIGYTAEVVGTYYISVIPPSNTFESYSIEGIRMKFQVINAAQKTCQVGVDYTYPAIDSTTAGRITIPETVDGYTVVRIGDDAFKFCRRLYDIEIPNTVTSIGSGAFSVCEGLEKIVVPNSVIEIERNAFAECRNLKEIDLSSSLLAIGIRAFVLCVNLESIVIPNSVVSIDTWAFSNCEKLTEITIPESTVNISSGGAFASCSNLSKIEVDRNNKKYDSRDGCNAIFETATQTLIAGCKNTTIPYGTTSIGNLAFLGHEALTEITIPNTVVSIGMRAFEGCSGLEMVKMSENINTINTSAFERCTNLKEITIPNSVNSIGIWSFRECTGLINIYSKIEKPFQISSDVFSYRINDHSETLKAALYVPIGTKAKYESIAGWKEFKGRIVETEYEDDIMVSSISLSSSSLSLSQGKTQQLNVRVLPDDATDKSVTWSTNNESVAIVSNTGLVTAIAEGWATITCTANDGSGVNATCEVIVKNTYQGDVNQDDAVNGTDLVALSNIILGRKEQTSAADVNGDGSVNGTDIVALSNIILGRNKAPRRAVATGNGLSIEPFDINAGETKEMLIDLTNPNDEVTLVQFDLHLPEELTIKKNGSDLDFDMADRTSWRKHTLDANEVDGAYRFLLYSSSNTLIEGTEGAIIKVTVVADASFTGGKIVIDNILLVSPDEQETKPDAYELMIGSPTSDDGSAKLSIDEAVKDIKAGETKEMLIDLTNPNDEVTLVQFDLHLPEGLSIKKNGSDLDFDMADRTSWRKHTLDANEVDGAYRFLLYSSSNTLIEGTEGAIIKVTVVADASFTGGKIVIDNILLVSPDEQETKPDAYEYVLPDPSGISTILMDRDKNAPVYNLRGQRLSAPQKGINIVGGRKVVVK